MLDFPVLHHLLEFAQLVSVVSMMPSNHLILSPSSPLPSVFCSIRVFSSESALCIRWTDCWSFSFSINLSNEYSGLISFRIYRLDLHAVQGTLKSLLQHCSSSAVALIYGPALYMTVTVAMKSRHLLLGRKAVTNLDSILKSRDITLPTKVCLVKAVVFPVCTNVRVGPLRELSMEKLMLLNCVGEDS